MSNRAAWLDAKGSKLRVGSSDTPKPASGQLVVRNFAVAVNPVDWKIQDYGRYVRSFPTILGQDVAGEVHELGADVTAFKTGDRVFAHALSLATGSAQEAGFQSYTVVNASVTALIPEGISFADASVLPLAIDTAAVGLYASEGFGLPLPSLDPKPLNKTIVVWGGSSSVGIVAIQLAVASGLNVITTASKHNFSFVKDAGAAVAIDYKSSSVVEDVVEAVKKSGGDFAGVYDAISLPEDSYKFTVPIVEKLGGGPLATVLPGPEDLPGTVKQYGVFGINALTHPIWADYLTPALKSGKLQALPPPQVIGKGLESVQSGLDANKKGVSAKKVVIEL